MFNRYKIEQLESKISSLETIIECYKTELKYRYPIDDLKRQNSSLHEDIKSLMEGNRRLIDENIRLRNAYNTEALINDKLRKETE